MKRGLLSWKAGVVFLLVVAAVSLFIVCSKNTESPMSPAKFENTAVLSVKNPDIQAIIKIQELNTDVLMSHDNIVGTATGLTEDGRPAVLVLTKNEMHTQSLAKGIALKDAVQKGQIPEFIDGAPVRIMVVGDLKPMRPAKPEPGVPHTAAQTPPIQLGTSGGWGYDLANGYCCGGTLGSLIQIGGTKYVLSNYHVLMADIVAGGNNRVVTNGDPVIQPALIDVGCNMANAMVVAEIAWANNPTLPDHNIDAGIAQVISGMVDSDGAILEIGMLSSSTVEAYIGQAVKKSGRTTGLTRSAVSGLNASVSIAYDDECAGSAAFTKTFTGQIIIENKRSAFLDSGDSGSLMVEDVDTNPSAVGLLFAGSRFTAIANPIDDVLSFYGASMVGN
jgi:hypothetical protein